MTTRIAAACALAILFAESCSRREAGHGRLLQVKNGDALGYIVDEARAQASGRQRVWVPIPAVVEKFEQDLERLRARDVHGYQRQYVGVFLEDRRALEVLLYCPELAKEFELDKQVPLVKDGCLRTALYLPETRELKLDGYPPLQPLGSAAVPKLAPR